MKHFAIGSGLALAIAVLASVVSARLGAQPPLSPANPELAPPALLPSGGDSPLYIPPPQPPTPAPQPLPPPAQAPGAPQQPAAAQPASPQHSNSQHSNSQHSSQRLSKTITAIAREHIPHHYEDTSKWGGKTKVFDGLYVKREGLQIKTHRNFKEVNHGLWTLYRVTLVDPQHEFSIAVENERELGDGVVGFDLVFTAQLDAFARRSRWVRGVQLFSISANAEARVSLRLSCRLATYLDVSVLPPDVIFDPKVTAAKLELVDFRVRRISQLGSDIAEPLGDSIEGLLKRKVAEKGDKLVEKINAKIDQHRDDLRLSLHELLGSQWSKLQKYVRRKDDG